jgi:bifunctional pyridoxal-dependent enzyme with beta-cystathionase and maltose regulon repressor activities
MSTDPPNDFEETVLETIHEMETEKQITMILDELHADVIAVIEDDERASSIDRNRLIALATLATHAGS